MKKPIQRTLRRRSKGALRGARHEEVFTSESAKDYVLDLHARGKLRIKTTGSPEAARAK